jgi:hypothetical protein
MIGLAVDVEKNDIGICSDCTLYVRKEHGVFHLALEEIDGLLTHPVICVVAVVEQTRQHLQEV